MIHRRALVLALVALAALAPSGAAAEIAMREALAIGPVGTGGRRPYHADAVEALVVRGAWTAPREGDVITGPGGRERAWSRVEAAENGWIRARGWVHWAVELEEDAVMILAASGHGMVYVNGAPRAGDPYANGWTRLPVALHRGVNELLFEVGRGRVHATLLDAPQPRFLSTREPTLPTLIEGEAWAVPAGVVVVNGTAEAQRDLVLRASGGGLPTRESRVPVVAPMTTRKVPFMVGGALAPGTRACDVELTLLERDGAVERVLHRATVGIPVRRADEPHRRTFISAIDGSAQYYGVRPRPADAPDGPSGLILTLHGASVEGFGQALVYGAKDWATVVAPTNRRPYGFDWEDWGRLDALEVLDRAMARYDVDPDRVYLTGHSMGGHGTWHLGVTFAPRLAAIGPSAGWRSFGSYAGAARLEDERPVVRELRRATNASDTEALVENLRDVGVYVLHGDADDNVPVEQARHMRGVLEPWHEDFAYHEQPGAGHWWGNQCCDWPPMMDFFRARRRAPADAIEFRTAHPAIASRARWLTVEQVRTPLAYADVRARVDRAAGAVVIETDNVERLAVDVAALGDVVSITIDDETVALPSDAATAHLRRSHETWTLADGPAPPEEKGPRRAGPFKEAYRNGVVLVYGTRGDDEANAWAFAKARFDAETFWYRGNGSFEVVADVDFDPEAERDRNVVLYGNAATNAAWPALLGAGPVVVEAGAVRIGDRVERGDDLACLVVRPRPGSDVAMVGAVGGTGLAGMRLTDRLPVFVSGVAYPDLLVIDASVLDGDEAGVRAAGSFGNRWDVETGTIAFGSENGNSAPDSIDDR